MVSKLFSATICGIYGQIIEIEASVNKGLKNFAIVGLPDASIKEAKERVNSAVRSSKLKNPLGQTQKTLINLAPAHLKKEGSSFDLAIALGYLLSSQQVKFNQQGKIFVGELSLDGLLKPIFGSLLFALKAKEAGFQEIILPKSNAQEAALANLDGEENQLKVIGAESLREVIDYLEGRKILTPTKIAPENLPMLIEKANVDFAWIKGQENAKRGIKIAASGAHNVLLQGPPGTGKTLLAKSIVSILPKLDLKEMIELTKIYSSANLLNDSFIVSQRPFRSPHHSSSEAALLGGGSPIRPGEITLAHRGVLFLDEFPEFHRDVLESLRQPLEEGVINIQRARQAIVFPAKFMLIASANPCPCGFYQDSQKQCSCLPSQIHSYQRKLTGPLIDRFDLFCLAPSQKYEKLSSENEEGDISEKTKQDIEKARVIQKARFKNDGILTNSEMNPVLIKKYCRVNNQSENILRKWVDSGDLSGRGLHKILKLSRTIADLENENDISLQNVLEALSYRQKGQS